MLTTDAVLTRSPRDRHLVEVTGLVVRGVRGRPRRPEGCGHGNAELDSLLGPLLKAEADGAGVVLTRNDDGQGLR